MLSEAYAYASFRDRILSTSRFVEENLNYVRDNAATIRKSSRKLTRRRSSARGCRSAPSWSGRRSSSRSSSARSPEKHPVDGHVMNLRKDVSSFRKRWRSTGRSRGPDQRVPSAYFVPSALVDAVDRLHAHGIVATPSRPRRPCRWRSSGLTRANRRPAVPESQRANPQRRLGQRGSTVARRYSARGDDPAPRAASRSIFEPRSDDGLTNWNFLDQALRDAKVYPIVRTRN